MLEWQNRRLMSPVLVADAVAVDPLVDVLTDVRAKTAPQGQVPQEAFDETRRPEGETSKEVSWPEVRGFDDQCVPLPSAA